MLLTPASRREFHAAVAQTERARQRASRRTTEQAQDYSGGDIGSPDLPYVSHPPIGISNSDELRVIDH